VGPDLIDAVTRKDPHAKQFFKPTTKRQYAMFDLQGYVRHQLKAAGLQEITQVAMDTYANEPQFFSYRRTTHRGELDYGRHISAITLRERRALASKPYPGVERRKRIA
jgi:hypothetical protein